MATDGLRIFSGSSHPQLAKEICECLNIPPGRLHTVRFSNENLKVKIDENVREQDVFVVQTSCPPLSEHIIEIFIVIRQGDNYGILNPIGILPEGDKETRMSAQSAKIEAGQVYLPKQAPWLGDLQAELLQFPHGRHDDQVDSISQFLNWIQGRPGSRWAVQEFLV